MANERILARNKDTAAKLQKTLIRTSTKTSDVEVLSSPRPSCDSPAGCGVASNHTAGRRERPSHAALPHLSSDLPTFQRHAVRGAPTAREVAVLTEKAKQNSSTTTDPKAPSGPTPRRAARRGRGSPLRSAPNRWPGASQALEAGCAWSPWPWRLTAQGGRAGGPSSPPGSQNPRAVGRCSALVPAS